jgi:hypothetical protein
MIAFDAGSGRGGCAGLTASYHCRVVVKIA